MHIHSCLSPCGDDDMTPANIVGMAKLKELDVIAVTDHNSCRNCLAVLELAKEAGIVALCGMELTTQEEVHVICLFAKLEDALSWSDYVYDRLIPILNNEEIFGHQWQMDREETIVYSEPKLLINATTISFDQVYDLVTSFHGIMIPAHIDKNSNSLLSNLGFIPEDSKFTCVEIKDLEMLHKLKISNPYLRQCNIISNSDAHSLCNINEAVHSIYARSKNSEDILQALKGM